MVDIILVQTPPWGVYAPPLGTAYLSSYLKNKGFSVKAFDANAALFNISRDESLWNFEKKDEWNDKKSFNKICRSLDKEINRCIDRILSANPIVVGLSVNQNSLLFSLELAKRIKQVEDKLIISGGWGCFNKHERDILAREEIIDAFVIGEGEESLSQLIYNLKKDRKIRNIQGVMLANSEMLNFSPRPFIKDLDKLFFPTYDEFELTDYQNPILCMLATRGCIGRCAFCNDRIYQGELRCRSPEKIVQEMEYHVQNNNISDFIFNDLIINGDLEHLSLWCDLVIERNLKVRWFAQALARPDMDLDLLYKMKEAGCQTLQFGIESGSNKILRRMKKIFNIADAERILSFTRKADIKVWVNYIVGFPGEDKEAFEATVNFIKRNRMNIDRVGSVNTCNVVFNSDLMVQKENYGVILSDNPELLEISWYTLSGNCDKLRKEKLQTLVSVLEDLELPLGQTNLFVAPA